MIVVAAVLAIVVICAVLPTVILARAYPIADDDPNRWEK